MHYVLGLDIGITSVGWATLALDMQDEPVRILDLGARIFERAEIPKTGESLAFPRRIARGTRRRIRRRRFRIARIRKYLVQHQILTHDELQSLYMTPSDIFTLRKDGLYRPLTSKEWAKILIYLAKHRGFKSNRRATTAATTEDGVVLKAIQENEKLLKKYQTVGEMMCEDAAFQIHKRNKGDSYAFTVSRYMLLDEIKKLYAVQRTFQKTFADKTLENEYIDIFSSQRNFDEGPACGPYSGNQVEKMIGTCSLEKGEKRAPKASFAFMAFNLWQKINNLRYKTTGEYHFLSQKERDILYHLAWKKDAITYKDIRKKLSLPENARFKGVPYQPGIIAEDIEKKQKFSWVKAYHEMRKALDTVYKNRITDLSHEQIDVIAYAFSVYKNDASIARYLDAHEIAEKDQKALLNHLKTLSKFGHISIKACYKMLPFLEQGQVYTQACKSAGYDFQDIIREEIKDIPNPVVKRAISQTLKVIRAVKRKYGCMPVEIHIELARELAKSYADRDKMKKSMNDNQVRNEKIRARLIKEFGILQPKGQDIVKFKLYEQQNGICAYSLKPFDVQRFLHEPDYAEVDHIIPYSRSMDDSYHNKVVVLTAENRQKGNRTPLEYLQKYPGRQDAFVTWVKANIRDYRKRDNLLIATDVIENDEMDWKDRNLNDTRYISTFVYNYLLAQFQKKALELTPGYTERKRRILSVNGAITAYIRKRLGIPKIRANGDLHHAVDAVIIAAVTTGVIQKITRYSKMRELYRSSNEQETYIDTRTGEILPQTHAKRYKQEPFPEPWPYFRKELEARVSDHADEAIQALQLQTYKDVVSIHTPFVSRMPKHKVTGQAHEETIKSPKLRDEGYSIVKTKLSDLKLEDGEIQGYYNKESDMLLYNALKEQLAAYGGKGRNAFDKPFYKPTASGKQGPLVKKVKIVEKSNLNVAVYGGKGIAKNGAMIRADIFGIEEKGKLRYYIVPIYVSDTIKEYLPNKAIVAYKPYNEWKDVEDKDFLFSLYPNDLIYVRHKTGMNPQTQKGCSITPPKNLKEAFFYYKGCNISTGSCVVENHDNTWFIPSFGIKTLVSLEKYVVDVLGNIHKVKKEKRMPFRPKV